MDNDQVRRTSSEETVPSDDSFSTSSSSDTSADSPDSSSDSSSSANSTIPSTTNTATDTTPGGSNSENASEINAPENDYELLNFFISQEENNNVLEDRLIVSANEILFGIKKIAKEHNLNNKVIVDLLQLINSFFPRKILPDNQYQLDKMFYPIDRQENHAVCTECDGYIGVFTKNTKFMTCPGLNCGAEIHVSSQVYRDYFVVFDINSQLKKLVTENEDYYLDNLWRPNNDNNNFRDIQDGFMYKNFQQNLISAGFDGKYVSLTFNTDGTPSFKSSKYQLWPIHLMVNELPREVKLKKVLTFSVWLGRKKPNMVQFFRIFVQAMNKLSAEGLECTLRGERHEIKVYPICCCVDTMARGPLQGLVQFNGEYGCNWCLHPGEVLPSGGGFARKYTLRPPNTNGVIRLRNHEDSQTHAMRAYLTNETVSGFRELSELLNLYEFNIVNGFVPDRMHCVDLGVPKMFFNLWAFTHLNMNIMKRLNDILEKCKAPTLLARLTRSVEERKFWKAREWLNWLLHYSLPALTIVPSFTDQHGHWARFVNAMFIIMQDELTQEDLNRAQNCLNTFLTETENIYGKVAMSFNLHITVKHLIQSIEDWGPLWSHSGNNFESANGSIRKMVHAANGVHNQIGRSLIEDHGLDILQNKITEYEDSVVLNIINRQQTRRTQKSLKVGANRYFGKQEYIGEEVQELHPFDDELCVGYTKLLKDNIIFKSCRNPAKRSNNSFALTSFNNYIHIEQFILDTRDQTEYTVYHLVRTEDEFPNCPHVKTIRHIEENIQITETRNIKSICVVIKVAAKTFISAVPYSHNFS